MSSGSIPFYGLLAVSAGLLLTPSFEAQSRTETANSFSIGTAMREADRVVTEFRPEIREQWDAFLKSRGLDERVERETTKRLKDAYFDRIEEWGHTAESCEPEGTSRRWLPRLLNAFRREELAAHKGDVVRVLGSLAADRLSECAQAAEDGALRAERELHAFVAERLKTIFDFLESLEPGTVRASTRFRVSRLEKHVRQTRPLADRSVSINALRLRTLAAEADPRVAEHLEDDPAFQKPFSLGKALAQLEALNGNARPKESNAPVPLAAYKSLPATLPPKRAVKSESPPTAPNTSSASGSESLSVPWLLQ